jgi:ABC-type transporter Mla subunit MlaD
VFEPKTTQRLGGAAIVLTIAAMALVLGADGTALRRTDRATVLVRHAGALLAGADVTVAGHVIGRVDRIVPVTPAQAAAPDHPLHPEGGAAIHLAIERRRAAWASPEGEFVITSPGLVGKSYVAILPPPDGAPGRPLADGDVVRGRDPVRLEQVLAAGLENSAAMRRVLADLGPSAAALRDGLGALEADLAALEPTPGGFAALGAALGDVRREAGALADLLDAGGVDGGRLVATASAAAATWVRLRGAVERVGDRAGALAADLRRIRGRLPPDLAARTDAIAAALGGFGPRLAAIADGARAVADDLARGRGTVGALLHDPEFLDEAKQLGKMLKRQPWKLIGREREPVTDALDE